MSRETIVALIEAAPRTVVVFGACFLVFVFRAEIRRALPRIGAVEVLGIKFTVRDIEQWAQDSNKKRNLGVTAGELEAALRRGARSQDAYRNTRLLWVDDHPENNFWERRALESLGAVVDVAVGNDEAWDLIRRKEYDILVSDLRRDNGEEPRDLPHRLATYLYHPTVIYYVGELRTPIPEEAFGATIYPDKLINLVTDVVQRLRW